MRLMEDSPNGLYNNDAQRKTTTFPLQQLRIHFHRKQRVIKMSEDELSRIHRFLGLDNADKRLRLKADITKTTLFLTSKWKKGIKSEWISKIANRTCVSTRKIRENYIEPLIDEDILRETRDGYIEFVGLPENAEVPSEDSLTEQEIVEELEEENEMRNQLGKKPLSLEEWKKTRPKRLKPLGRGF